MWKIVPGYPYYEVSDVGEVRRATDSKRQYKAGYVLKPKLSKHGYMVVSLWDGARYYHVGVHRLVCMAFHGEPANDNLQVCHNDGDRLNNTQDNLRWGTAKENADDRAIHDNWTPEFGVDHHNAILNDEAVAQMRRLSRSGQSIVSIAAAFGVHKVTARDAIQGRTWKHVSEEPDTRSRKAYKSPRK